MMARGKKAAAGDDDPDFDGPSPDLSNSRSEQEAQLADELEALWAERNSINKQMAEVRQRAKDAGLNSTVLQAAVKRRMETDEQRQARRSFEEELEAMSSRLGEFQHTTLGKAAMSAAGARPS
jgi:uncharacterized protein (UPF0335 family)